MEKRYYPAMPPIPRGSVPTRRAWHALDELLELLGLSRPLHERLEKQFSAEGVEEVRYLIRLIHLTVNTGRSQELGRAIVGILSKDSMQMKRAEAVSWIRICATSHKEACGDSSAAAALVTYLCQCDPAFEALRADLAFVELWLGRIYGKNARGLSPSPEYCAAVLSIKAGAFNDKPSGKRSLEDDYRFKRKEYVDAVAYAAKAQEDCAPPPPPLNIYEADNHFEMLHRAIRANLLTRGEAFVDEVSDAGTRLGVHPAPRWVALTIEELRTALKQREAEGLRQQPQILPLVGARQPSGREKKERAKAPRNKGK
jgi:hypothetical protein